MKATICAATLFSAVLAAGSVFAQGTALPQGMSPPKPASTGATQVVASGFQSATKKPANDKDVSEAQIAAGGLITEGNSQQLAITGSGKLKIRRGNNQYSAAAAGNFARASAPEAPDQGMQTTVENLQGNLRYDYFFAPHWSAFLSLSGWRDRFQGLDLRLNVDPGIAYYLIEQKKQQLWFEGGYDFEYDIRRDDALAAAAAAGTPLSKTEVTHSARLFAGFDSKVNDRVSFSTGVEYIQSVTEARRWRVDYNGAITSNIVGRFSTAVTFTMRYDHDPLPGVHTTDLMSSFNLVYSLL